MVRIVRSDARRIGEGAILSGSEPLQALGAFTSWARGSPRQVNTARAAAGGRVEIQYLGGGCHIQSHDAGDGAIDSFQIFGVGRAKNSPWGMKPIGE